MNIFDNTPRHKRSHGHRTNIQYNSSPFVQSRIRISSWNVRQVVYIECNVESGKEYSENRNFLPLFFANKGLDAINLGNILHHKSVKAMVPPYFKDHSVPIISYSYTQHFFVNGFNIFFATEVVRISNAVYLKDLLVGFPGSSS
jgi:hypothetical protein